MCHLQNKQAKNSSYGAIVPHIEPWQKLEKMPPLVVEFEKKRQPFPLGCLVLVTGDQLDSGLNFIPH